MRYSRYLQAARAARYLSFGTLASLSACVPEQLVSDAPVTATSAARTSRLPREPEADIDGDTGALRRRIELAARDLRYRSETDAPFTFVRTAVAVPTPPDDAVVLAAFGFDPRQPVERISIDEFFARHIERVDPFDIIARREAPAFRRLRELLRHAADDVQVYRIGTITVDCLIVGTDRDGHLVGVRTVVVET